jgi:hypothetical protein
VNGVVYATLNIQSSCDNLCDTLPEPAEWAARNRPDILWMQQTWAPPFGAGHLFGDDLAATRFATGGDLGGRSRRA